MVNLHICPQKPYQNARSVLRNIVSNVILLVPNSKLYYITRNKRAKLLHDANSENKQFTVASGGSVQYMK